MRISIQFTYEQYDFLLRYIDDRDNNPHDEAMFEGIIAAMDRGFEEFLKEEEAGGSQAAEVILDWRKKNEG